MGRPAPPSGACDSLPWVTQTVTYHGQNLSLTAGVRCAVWNGNGQLSGKGALLETCTELAPVWAP